MSDPIKTVVSPLDAVYEKYKHLNGCLSDPEWCNHPHEVTIAAQATKKAREDFANQLKTTVNCAREMKDWEQCGYCPYRICEDSGRYDCHIDKILRSASGSQQPEPKERDAE